MAKIVINNDRKEMVLELAKLIESCSNEQILEKDLFNIGISGGSISDLLIECLSKVKTDISKWRVFFCDERVVPEDSPDSTYGVYKKKLFDSKITDLTFNQFVTIKQGVSTEEAAVDYEAKLKLLFPGEGIPSFDMLLLGMGPDGHTCSLFPGHSLLNEKSRWVAPITDSPKPPLNRVTLTYPVINNAKVCTFAVFGKEKAEIVCNILKDKKDLPATRVNPTPGKLFWFLDSAAASRLSHN